MNCRECGATFDATRRARVFCGTLCRMTFNQRRRERGAILYDLFMAQRFERDTATEKGTWSSMCRIAGAFRDEDTAQREGRKSWQSLAASASQTIALTATKGRV